MAARKVSRLPTASGAACPLPAVPGKPLAQHLSANAGTPQATPPSVAQQPTPPTPTAKQTITTATAPWKPAKGGDITATNSRTAKGATISDLVVQGRVVGTIAQLSNGKFSVRDVHGVELGNKFATGWLARNALAQRLNAHNGQVPPPTQQAPATVPTPAAPPPPPAPIIKPAPAIKIVPAPAPAPPPPPTPKPTPPAVVPPQAPAVQARRIDPTLGHVFLPDGILNLAPDFTPGRVVQSEAIPDGLTSTGRMTDSAADSLLKLGGYSGWKRITDSYAGGKVEQTTVKTGNVTTWELSHSWLGHIGSFVRVPGGFAMHMNPEFLDALRQAVIKDGGTPETADFLVPKRVAFYVDGASKAQTYMKEWVQLVMRNTHRTLNALDTLPIGLLPKTDTLENLAEKAALRKAGTREFKTTDPGGRPITITLPITAGETATSRSHVGYKQGKNVTRTLTEKQLRHIATLHRNTARDKGQTDAGLDEIARIQGWVGDPVLIPLAEFLATLDTDTDFLWTRGDTKGEYAADYKYADKPFYGKGIFGNGTYTGSLGKPRQAQTGTDVAQRYARSSIRKYGHNGVMTLGKVKTGVDVSVITHVEWATIRAKEEAYWRRQLNKPNNSGHLGSPVEFYAYCRQMLELLGNHNSHGIYLALLGVDAVIGIDPDVSASTRAARIDPNNPVQYTLIINRTAVVMAEGSVNAWAAGEKNRGYGGYVLDRSKHYIKGNNSHLENPRGFGVTGIYRSQQPTIGDIIQLLDGAMSPDADWHKRRFQAWDDSSAEPPAGWDGFGRVFLDTGDGKGTIWRPVNELIDWWINGIELTDQSQKVISYAESVAQERARGKKIKKAQP